MFCSRLKNLLTYYCNSRQVKESFKILFSLLVQIKSSLRYRMACLDHVLTVEGDKWLECDALANVIDIYFANHTFDGRPKFVRSDFRNKTASDNHANQAGNGKPAGTISGTNDTNSQVNLSRDGKGAKGQTASKSGLCFSCHSPGHKQANCPLRSGQNRSGDTRVAARNFACAIEAPVHNNVASGTPQQLSQMNDDRVNPSRVNNNADCLTNICRANGSDIRSANNTDGETASVHDNAKSSSDLQTRTQLETSAQTPSSVSNVGIATYRSARTMVSSDHRDACANNFITDGLSKLNFIPIRIQGIDGIHNAFHDSGSEINLIQRYMLHNLTHLPSMGRVKIKGVIGPAVETDIILLDVSPVVTAKNCKNIAPPLLEIFAVCDELNEQMILTADTVRRLTQLENYESVVIAPPSLPVSSSPFPSQSFSLLHSFIPFLSFPFHPSPPLPFKRGSGGITPGKNVGFAYGRR
jgi:hypothetical protein